MNEIFVIKDQMLAIMIMLFVITIGYLLGRINVKGVRLGSSGVFIVAIIVGCVFGALLPESDTFRTTLSNVGKIASNIGLVLFITAIGYTAGPTFVKSIKSGAIGFVVLSVVVIVSGLLTTLLFFAIDKNLDMGSALGLMMGALTSTPGLSSTKEAFGEIANTTNAVAYPFGVLGACLFVQIVPKFFKRSFESAKEKVNQEQKETTQQQTTKEFFEIDKLGFAMYCFAGIVGIVLGSITIPGINFNLTTTGGCLVSGLVFGLIGNIGKINLKVPKTTLSVLKEVGLVFFLYGSGISGGFGFIPVVKQNPIFFLYGALITIIPMIVGFLVVYKGFKMDVLTSLGALTGAMTSTPALGALEQVAQTENASSSYTASYPIALFLLVIIPQIIKLFI